MAKRKLQPCFTKQAGLDATLFWLLGRWEEDAPGLRHSWVWIAAGGNAGVGRVLMPAGWEVGNVGLGSCPVLIFTLVPCKVPISSEWMRKAQL